MKTLNAIALGIVLSILLSSCGKGQEASTATEAPSSYCPTGRWVSTTMYDTITVGSSGIINLNNNGCVTTGYVTCTGGGDFIMELTSKSKAALDLNECQDIGTWKCTYSINGTSFSVFCPESKSGNVYSPAKDFYR